MKKQAFCKSYLLLFILVISAQSIFAQRPVGVPGNWTLNNDLTDEFRGSKIDTNKWDHDPADFGPWSWEPNNVNVNKGKLRLKIRHKNHTRAGKRLHFTSGMIRSRAEITYGYFEAKIKAAPKHPGVSSAFWSHSIDETPITINGKRIGYNEIDFPELTQRVNNVNVMDWNVIRSSDNNGRNGGNRVSVRQSTGDGITEPNFDPRARYHIYGCLWTPSKIEFYIDGKKVGKTHFNKYQKLPMRLVLSLGLREPFYKTNPNNGKRSAIATPKNPNGFPSTMLVDYVRTWQGTRAKTNNLASSDLNTNLNPKQEENTTNEEENTTSGDFFDLHLGPNLDDISAYPIPAKDELNIEAKGDHSVSIYNLSGAKIMSTEFKDSTVLNISELTSGIYIVNISNEGTTISKKIVVE